MHNWKRILAGVGTAALLASNLGSVTQAVFADDDYREQIPAAQQNIDKVDESDESGEGADIDAQDLGSEDTPAVEQGQTGSNPNGNPNGSENGDQDGQSGQNGQDDDAPGTGDENAQDGNTSSGENDDRNSDNQNTNNDSNGDQDQHTGDNQGAGDQGDDQNNNENGDEPGTDDTNPQNLADDQTDPDANPDAPNSNPADENPDLDGGTEGSESSTPALQDSLRITLETHESSKRDVTRSEDGTYLYDLGETASTTVTLSNPEDYRLEESDNAVVRVYMQFTDNAPEDPATDDEAETDDAGKDADDADLTEDETTDPDEDADSDTDEADETDTSAASTQGSTRQPGTYTIPAEDDAPAYSYTVYGLDDGITCYEIDRPINGDTFSLEMTSVYGKDTDGGENQIWVVALTADEAKTLDAEAAEQNEDADEQNEAENTESEDIDEAEDAETESEDERETDDTNEIVVGVAAVPGDEELVDHLQWIANDADTEVLTQNDETENYIVTVKYSAKAEIPEDAVLKVTEYSTDSDEYKQAAEQAGGEFKWLLDVSFCVGDEEIEPKDTVTISVADKNPVEETDTNSTEEQSADVTIIHFAESGMETIKATDDSDVRTFGVDSLSIVGELIGQITGDDGIMLAATVTTTKSSNEGIPKVSPDKPDYQDTEVPSGAKTGVATGVEGISADAKVAYDSDPATSDIEDDFELNVKNTADVMKKGDTLNETDGKILTDKSVIYNKDDYSSGLSYDAGEFGVTLSALSQEYHYTTKENVKVPVDVVFIIDTSGSMTLDANKITLPNGSTQTRQAAAVNAANAAIKQILDNHPANRVGVVTFASGSWELMPLGRYTANDNEYLVEVNAEADYTTRDQRGQYIKWKDANYVNVASSLKKVDGGSVTRLNPSDLEVAAMTCGTYTQSGIARGYNVFNNVSDTTYTATLSDGTTCTVTRQPIIVLLSDGEPTYCNDDYDGVLTAAGSRSGTVYGDGTGRYTNDGNGEGIMGFYTIESAYAYKEKVKQKYQVTKTDVPITDAKFYTIGEGIDATGYETGNVGDDYRRAVLNPTSTNLDVLSKDTNDSDVRRGEEQGAWRRDTSQQLLDLLNDSNSIAGTSESTVPAKGTGTANNGVYNYDQVSNSSTEIPIIKNNYYSLTHNDHSYADQAFFGDLSEEDLKKYFYSILQLNQGQVTYVRSMNDNGKVTVEDQIGSGMEVKGDSMYLRYGSTNYELVKDTVKSTSTTTYYKLKDLDADGKKVLKYTDVYPENSLDNSWAYYYPTPPDKAERIDMTFDISKIEVKVTTDDDGNQTVDMVVPSSVMPNVHSEHYGSFYYRELPVRLIYKVGLTDKAVEAANKAVADGGTVTYYTNAYSEDTDGGKSALSTGTFEKAQQNTYNFSAYDSKTSNPTSKSTNPTETVGTSFSSSATGNNVCQALGNNGRLCIGPKPDTTNVAAKKVWDDSESTHNSIQVQLLRDGKVIDTQTLSESNDWTYRWTDLPNKILGISCSYTVKEVDLSGYIASYSTSYDADTETTIWTITNTPESMFGVGVVKKWFNNDGSPMETAPDKTVTGTLHRNKAKSNTGVTVELVYNYRSGSQYSGYTWHPVTLQTIQVATGSSFSYYYANSYDRRQSIPDWTPEISDSSVATVTLSGDSDDSRQVNVQITGNDGDYVKITVGTDTVFNYSTPNMHIEFAQNYTAPSGSGVSGPDTDWSRSFTLTKDNNWSQYWTPEELGEESGYKYSYWAEENKIDGYTTVVDYGTEDKALSPTESGKTITIRNTKDAAYELPETGGMGALPIELGGSAAMLGAMFVGYSRRRRDRKEGEM